MIVQYSGVFRRIRVVLAYQEYYTLEDYQSWEGSWELIAGMPYARTPSPKVTHQTVSFNVAFNIKEKISNHQSRCGHCSILMETDWQVSNDTVVRPDVMVVCQDIDEKVMVTPGLIIEVVSSSSTKRDEVMKFDLYQREGVLYYILVYPKKRVAKLYKNQSSGFRKLANSRIDAAEIELGSCGFTIDFCLIWR